MNCTEARQVIQEHLESLAKPDETGRCECGGESGECRVKQAKRHVGHCDEPQCKGVWQELYAVTLKVKEINAGWGRRNAWNQQEPGVDY